MPKKSKTESDQAYVAKVALYVLLGLIWIKWNGATVFPVGLALGLGFAHHDHFQIDRKIEYVVLILATLFAYAGPGIFITLVG